MISFFKPKIRTRFAPSPTGYVHLGSLRSALFEYLFAKKNGGTFYLRLEDTDQSREVAGAEENLLKVLKWAGIEPEEGIMLSSDGKTAEKGKFGPYTQSKRLDIYAKFAQELLDNGSAYRCFCTSERLEELRSGQVAAKKPTRYDGLCRSLSAEGVSQRLKRGDKSVIRMRLPENKDIIFNDLIRGEVKVNSSELDEQVLMKADGFPTYHLAHVVDDHLMKTTHVIRGEEWLPSTPKHLILLGYFGWTAPVYAHLPLILNSDKSKLSKRQGDVAVEDYRDKGYLPEALVNYVALLGWNPGTEKEIFSLEELVREFSFDKVHKAGAVFDVRKLDWMNGEYIKKLPSRKFVELAMPFLKKNLGAAADDRLAEKILILEQERVSRLSQAGENAGFFLADELEYPSQLLIWKKSDSAGAKKMLEMLEAELANVNDWSKGNLEKFLFKLIADRGLTNGEVLWPLRVALTGLEKSPPPFDVADILGKEKSLVRIQSAIKKLS